MPLIKTIKQTIYSSRQPAIFLARGAGIGMFITMTPTVGIQIPTLIILWSLCKHFNIFRFNFKIAFILTWITNYVTAIPFYFLFYITGVYCGNFFFKWNSPIDYQGFQKLWSPLFNNSSQNIVHDIGTIIAKIGGPLFLGCLPFAITSSIVVYIITLKTVIYYRKRHTIYYDNF